MIIPISKQKQSTFINFIILNMTHKKNKNQQSITPLTETIIPHQVYVSLPQRCVDSNISQILLKNYIRAKIDKKKIFTGLKFTAIILGNQQQLQITNILFKDNQLSQRQQAKIQNDQNEDKNVKNIVISPHTAILLQRAQKQVKKSIVKQAKNIPFFGLREQYNVLKSAIEKGLALNEDLLYSGLGTIKGILISGLSGTGKTTMIKVLQQQLDSKITFRILSSFNLLNKYVGGAEEGIRKLFEEVKTKLPACLIIEDLHLIFGKNMKTQNQTMLASLLTQIQNISYDEGLIVIGSYNSERELHQNLRRSGKFQKEIFLQIPRHHQRFDILSGYLKMMQLNHPISNDSIKSINLRMNGFNISQIQQILRDSFMEKGKQLTYEIVESVLKRFKPQQIKSLIVQVPEVYWKEIGGYEEVKKNIAKVIEWPLKYPEAYKKLGIEAMKGILLYGPPGCSKTMMAKAIATQSKLNFIGIKGPQLFSKYVGQSERAIRNIFKRARACSPCVIFFDEIDALATQRSQSTQVSDRILCQLLNQMDGIEGLKEVIIVAATNRPQILDKALLRPGRFDHLIYVGPPDLEARKEILKIYLSKMPISDQMQKIIEEMAEQTSDYTGAELSLICRAAALQALSENFQNPSVAIQHFRLAKSKVKNRLTKFILQNYQNFSLTLTYI